jgi:glycosyltransferase involved in cell wall biosynthesis
MKILTVAIPSYNSQDYLERAVDSLLGEKDIEVLIVDDGSTDRTAEIADAYEEKYPDIIRAIHKKNGGHGSGVNRGLKEAKGLYFKVLDSDDWFDTGAFHRVMETLRRFSGGWGENDAEEPIDLLIVNYVYERVAEGKQKVISYKNAFPENKVFYWDDMYRLHTSQNILMHSVIYRTEFLRECGLKLPEHTFYVDNLFVYQPLARVKRICYVNEDLYRYFIGREDQSVNEKVMMGRIDQQIKVTKLMIKAQRLSEIPSKKLSSYMVKYLAMMMTICTVFLIKIGDEESMRKKEEIWDFLEQEDEELSEAVKSCILGRSMQLKGRAGQRIIILGYKISRKIYGFS